MSKQKHILSTRKNCKSCLHRESATTEEPCFSCMTGHMAYTKWEPRKDTEKENKGE